MNFTLYDKKLSDDITSHATACMDELIALLKENQSSPTFELTYIRNTEKL